MPVRPRPPSRLAGRWAHLYHLQHPDRGAAPAEETPLLQEAADGVNGCFDLDPERAVWQEVVFDELVQILGPGPFQLHRDAGAGTGTPVAKEAVSGRLLYCPGLSCSRFRFWGREELHPCFGAFPRIPGLTLGLQHLPPFRLNSGKHGC